MVDTSYDLRRKMDRSFLFHLFIFYSLVCASLEVEISVWPKPRSMNWHQHRRFTTISTTSFRILTPNHLYLRRAAARYGRLILTERHLPIVPPRFNASSPASPPVAVLFVSVASLSVPLQHGADESYSLSINNSGAANLTAATPWGAIRGLETFSQLVWGREEMWVPAGIDIWDAPLFPHRGFLLDTSRNFYPVRDLLRTIRAMAANKLNVFHWHLTDSHSFPLLLASVPELAGKGAYGPDMQYTPGNVRRVVQYAMSYGVRVIPEVDMPGHTGSWAGAFPEIVTCANSFWWPAGTDWTDRLASEPGTGQLNPLIQKTYEVINNVIHDIADMFPENFFHAGADEVAPRCWKADPSVQTFLSNGGTLNQLLEIFINSTRPVIESMNRTVVYWEDVLLDGAVKVNHVVLPVESVILQTWNNGPNNTKRIVQAGYRAIVSSSDFYYLDCGHGGFVGNESRYDQQMGDEPGQPFNYVGGNGGSWCAPFKSWQRVYDYDITYGLTEEETTKVVGGEVALWSEQADGEVLDGRVWPRASAMGEALWSGNRDQEGLKRYAEATNRLNEWRERMVGRGIAAEPIQPRWCVTHPGMCNTVQ